MHERAEADGEEPPNAATTRPSRTQRSWSVRTDSQCRSRLLTAVFVSQVLSSVGFLGGPGPLSRRSLDPLVLPLKAQVRLRTRTSIFSVAEGRGQNTSRAVSKLLCPPHKPLRPPWLAKQESRRITNNLKRMLQTEPVRARAYFDALCLEGKADSFHYAVMVDGCASMTEGRELLEQMQQVGMTPHVVIFNSLLKKILREEESTLDGALGLVEEMRDLGVHPDERTYTMLLQRNRELERWEECKATFAEMKNAGLDQGHASWREFMFVFDCKMASIKLKTLLRDVGNEKNRAAAFALFERLRADNQTDAVICNTMLNACRTQEEADSVWGALLRNGNAPTSSSFNTLLRLLCEQQRFSAAKRLLQDAEDARLADGRTYTRLIGALHRAGREEEARAVFDKSRRFGLNRDVDSYLEVLQRVESSTRTKRLQGLMQRSRQEGFEMFEELERNGTADAFAYNVAIEHSQGSDAAVALFERMQARGVPLSSVTWNCIVKALVNDGRLADARQKVDEMVKAGERPSKRTLRPLVGALKRLGRREELAQVKMLQVAQGGSAERRGDGGKGRRGGGGGGPRRNGAYGAPAPRMRGWSRGAAPSMQGGRPSGEAGRAGARGKEQGRGPEDAVVAPPEDSDGGGEGAGAPGDEAGEEGGGPGPDL